MSTQVESRVEVPKKRKRGRETALDMVRSLGLVVLVIVPVWLLARAPSSDEAEMRVVDPAQAVEAFSRDAPGVPVPGELPPGWRATSATYDGPGRVRVGWVTPDGEYAEYSTATAAGLDELVGQAQELEPVVVEGVSWVQHRDGDGSLSLSRSYAGVTVVVGTLRSTADLGELEVLLRALRQG